MGARSSQSRGSGLNKSDGHLLGYFRNTFGAGGGAENPVPGGMIASGGNITNDYTDGGVKYRSHTFNSTGTFNVSSLAVGLPDSVDILVVGGGGGGGGGYYCGAGGAGGVRTNLTGSAIQNAPTEYTASVGNFIVTVGGGGDGGPATALGTVGSASSITIGAGIVAAGGGHGGIGAVPSAGPQNGGSGGSGGGGAYSDGTGGIGTDAGTPTFQGYPGGTGSPLGGAGGGGAGGVGVAYAPPWVNNAGVGTEYNITGISSFYAAGGSGGGVGGPAGMTPRQSGIGGKGQRIHTGPGSAPTADLDALSNTGSGGGGADRRNTSFTRAGNGSSGIVVVRYRI
jgi:hypothetical protein